MVAHTRHSLALLLALVLVGGGLGIGAARPAHATTAACFRDLQTGAVVRVDLQGNSVPPLVLQAPPTVVTRCLVDRVGDLFCSVVRNGAVVMAQVLIAPVRVVITPAQPVVLVARHFRVLRLHRLRLARCVLITTGHLVCA